MSLTAILRHKPFQELRTKLKEDFPKPSFDLTGELLAPPRTKNHDGIGRAFDYLLRFYLEHKYPKVVTKSWIAEKVFALIESQPERTNSTIYFEGKALKVKDFRDKVGQQLDEARKNHKNFLKTGKFTDNLFHFALLLSQLDVIFRANYFDPKLGIYDSEDIKDLKALTKLINDKNFVAKKESYLNPTFGEGSMLVGGADADLILDDLLIDIKTIKHLTLEREYFNQLIGYYVLSLIGGVSTNEQATPIKRVGIYFARHGQLWTITIAKLGDKNKFDEFKDWFVDYIKKERGKKTFANK